MDALSCDHPLHSSLGEFFSLTSVYIRSVFNSDVTTVYTILLKRDTY